LKICLVHNFYLQLGGEEQAFAAESSILEEHGHRVFRYTIHNDRIKELNPLKLACCTLWNKTIAHELLGVIRKIRPDVIHFHNTFPLISPSAYYAAKAEGVPVVQTLHNYRFLCPNALFFRDGHLCEDCMGKFVPWPGILHACYRDSRAAATVAVGMLLLHRVLRTYNQIVDVYIALTEFARNKFIEGGLPAEKIVVKPNFIGIDKFRVYSGRPTCRYALFVGRLSPEKGIETLLEAWKRIGKRLPLIIVGDGPMACKLKEKLASRAGIEWMGAIHREEVIAYMKKAELLVFPSVCIEGFGTTMVEAFAAGLPVIASKHGAMAEIVEDGRTGLHFEAGNPKDLASKVEWAWTHPKEMKAMGRAARKEHERKYTAEINYKMLIDIYETAIERARIKK